ncbi:MAG: glucosaminidase domain-containing protein [Candidatus Sericytochromatia bacterium]|nr:glucosaminidase domain-containing protein [Candidatus Sericytochromatia bacterium]
MPIHVVRRGETLSRIAAEHDTSIRKLMRLNRITDPHRIDAGERLRLPADARVEAPRSRSRHARSGLTPPGVAAPGTPGAQAPMQPAAPGGESAASAPRRPRPLDEDRLLLQTEQPRPAARADVDRLARDIEGQQLNPKSPFLREMVPAALEIERKYGLPAKVILAQAALESNWGKAAIGTYNVFGIKGRGSRGSLGVMTREHLKGRWVRVRENFAHYGSYQEAFEAYARTLHNGYYQRALAAKDNPVKFARALQGVYATDPGYAGKLISIMRSALGT